MLSIGHLQAFRGCSVEDTSAAHLSTAVSSETPLIPAVLVASMAAAGQCRASSGSLWTRILFITIVTIITIIATIIIIIIIIAITVIIIVIITTIMT